MKYWYDGSLSSRKNLPEAVKKALTSLRAQRERCSNKNASNYPKYGAKGISVEYGTREFVGWYIEKYKSREWSDPTVGRLDHSGNYCFDNIEMQERADNSKERNDRLPTAGIPRPKHWRPVHAYRDGKHFKTFASVSFAAKFFGVSSPAICNARDGRSKSLSDGTEIRKT